MCANQIIIPNPNMCVIEKIQDIDIDINVYPCRVIQLLHNNDAYVQSNLEKIRGVWYDSNETFAKTKGSQYTPSHNCEEDISVLMRKISNGTQEGEHVVFASNFSLRSKDKKGSADNIIKSLSNIFQQNGFIFKRFEVAKQIQRMMKIRKILNESYHG